MILVDLTYIKNGDTTTGIATVACTLLSEWNRQGVKDFALLVDISSKEYFTEQYPTFLCVVCSDKFILDIPNIERTLKHNVSVVFSPCINARSKVTRRRKMVGILHDVQKFEINKASKIKYLLYKIMMNFVLHKYSKVVTISEAEKEKIEILLPFLHNRLHVIYNSIVLYPCKELLNLRYSHYILNVNTLFPYKNILTLVKAFNEIKGDIPHGLIIKAKSTEYWNQEVMPFVEEHGLADRIQLLEDRLSATEMSYLYQKADLFVSPSTMEGFGLTPVEAAMYGTAVITSNIPALVESTRGMVNYYQNVFDYKELAALMQKVLNSQDELEKTSISKALAEKYSVQEQAYKYLKILNA